MISKESHQISVTLSFGSDPFQQRMPEALSQCGMLRRVLRFSPELAVLEPNETGSLIVVKTFPQYRLASRLLWGAWSRLPGRGRVPTPIVASAWFADRLASKYVPQSSIFQGYTALCRACLQAAKRHRAVTLVLNTSLHPRDWQREVIAECRNFSINPRHCDSALPASLIRRREREYELCDKILVLSSLAQRTFEEHGYEKKAVVVWPGVDHQFFKPPNEPRQDDLFRVCFVGRVELAKGIGYLLTAWKRLALPNAELVLIGKVYPETNLLFTKYRAENVRLLGRLPAEEVAKQYQKSSLLVLPSVHEGFGLVLLEAMASGLPVVATDRSGAVDCVEAGKEGLVVPARNAEALAEAILWCYQHRDRSRTMGRAARTKIEQRFTLAHYEARQIALYRSLAS